MQGSVGLEVSAETRGEIFPKPLPQVESTPPAAFDDTRVDIAAISPGAEARLLSLLHDEKPEGDEARANVADEFKAQDEKRHEAFRLFREWRDEVAMPVFAGFVVRLRAQGHKARALVRSVENGPGRHAVESVTLKLGLRTSIAEGRNWFSSGHVEASVTEYNGRRFEVSPEPEEPQGGARRRDAPPGKPVRTELPSATELEAEVLQVLERLKNRGY
jgi:hypothetical protein